MFLKLNTTDALCIEDPLHDVVIGNIEGSKFPDMIHFSYILQLHRLLEIFVSD